MTEQDIIYLGFTKEFCTEDGEDFYYYTYIFAPYLQLLSIASDEVKDNDWYVEFFDIAEDIRFTDASDVKQIIDLINKAKLF